MGNHPQTACIWHHLDILRASTRNCNLGGNRNQASKCYFTMRIWYPQLPLYRGKDIRKQLRSSKPSFVLNWGSSIPRQKAYPQVVFVPFYKKPIGDAQHQGKFWLTALRSQLVRRDLDHKSCTSCQKHRAHQ